MSVEYIKEVYNLLNLRMLVFATMSTSMISLINDDLFAGQPSASVPPV